MARILLSLFGLTTISNGLGLSTAASMNLAVRGSGVAVVNGIYLPKCPTQVPVGFTRTCDQMGWDSQKMWKQLSNQVSPWWKHSENESYIYYNKGDGQWWIDEPSGAGVYVVLVPSGSIVSGSMATATPPSNGWKLLGRGREPPPSVDCIAAEPNL